MAIAGWTHRFKITSDNTKVAASYGYGLVFDLSNAPAGFWANVKSDGSDIRVTKSDGSTQVPVGVREFDDTAETGLLYIKADGISTSEDTDFWVYYGNASAEAVADDDALGMHNVWSADHAAYYTMADGPSDDIINETGRYTDGTQPAGNSPTEATGKVGLAQDFTRASEERIDLGEPAYDISTGFTFACWIKFPDAAQYRHLLDRDHRDGTEVRAWQFRVNDTGELHLIRFNAAGSVVANFSGATTVDDDTWRFCVATFDTTAGSVLYVNGSSDGTDANTTNQRDTVSQTTIGATSRLLSGDQYRDHFDGLIDELQVIERALTADEVSTIYNNQLDPSAFWTAGAEEEIQFVENVQATALGSTSIQVTWDQFTNDESPPVAADGYEIEIDSGTPIDVGDVQTYTDEDLDPSTQYSYRVRAYYSGSPTEYTEWSEAVQATTDSETLTTIPRSFVITADIKLRDEAPEVEQPPIAISIAPHVIASIAGGSPAIRTWSVSGSTLTSPQTYSTGTSNNTSLALTRDGKWLFSGWGSGTTNPNQIFRRSNDEGTLGSEEQISGTPDASIIDLSLSPDGRWLAVCHDDDGSGDYSGTSLSIFSIDDGDLTLVTSISPPSARAVGAGWNDLSNRLIVTQSGLGDAALYSWNESSLSLLDTLSISTGSDPLSNVQWMEGGYAAIGRVSATTKLVNAEGDELVELDSASGVSGGLFARHKHFLVDASGSSRDAIIWDTSGGSFVEVDTIDNDAGGASLFYSGKRFVGVDYDGSDYGVNLFSFDGESASVIDTATWSSTVIQQIIAAPYFYNDESS